MWLCLVTLAHAQDFTEHVLSSGLVAFPQEVELVDLDADGDLDAIAVSATDLAWYENDGTGLFTPHDIGFFGRNVAVGDVDGDGALDLMVGPTLLTASSGFASRADLSGDIDPFSSLDSVSHVGDLDGDGDDDYLIAGGGELRIRGVDPFDVDYLLDVAAVAVHDLDGNGELDVVVVTSAGELGVVAQTDAGFGGYAAIGSVGAAGPYALDAGPLVGDPQPDVVVGTAADTRLFAQDDAGFSSATTLEADGRAWPRLVDLDGDGRLDVVLRGSRWLQNTEAGFVARDVASPLARGPARVGDADGDGTLDLLATDATTGFLPGIPDADPAAFGAAALIDGPLCGGGALTVGDVDQDGTEDLVVAGGCDGTVQTLHGQRTDRLAFDAPRVTTRAPFVLDGLLAADLDGDGQVDLTLGASGQFLGVLPGVAGGLGPVVEVSDDGAGRMVLATPGGIPTAVGRRDGAIRLLQATGAGGWTTRTLPLGGTTVVLSRDTDGDGATDEILSGSAFLDRYVFDGATWTFDDFLLPVGGQAWTVGLAVVQPGDQLALANPDLLFLVDPVLAFEEGLSTDLFRPGPFEARVPTLLAADLDLDGVDEILVGAPDGGLTVLDQLLEPRPERLFEGLPEALAARDLDGDGDTDLVKLEAGGRLTWLENRLRDPGDPPQDTGTDTGAPQDTGVVDTGRRRPTLDDDPILQPLDRGCGCRGVPMVPTVPGTVLMLMGLVSLRRRGLRGWPVGGAPGARAGTR